WFCCLFFFSSRRRHTRFSRDWSSDVCSSDLTIERAARDLRAGNIYVNRPITGAVVGRQPFGGIGLSGVGSKAGGPDYLLQFVDRSEERRVGKECRARWARYHYKHNNTSDVRA